MELLDYAEAQGAEAAKFSLATLEQARIRCHQFMVLLLGGAGALSGVGLAQWPHYRWMGTLALAAALWWFATAAWVAVRGLRSSPVRSWSHQGATVLDLHEKWIAYSAELVQEGKPAVDALSELRQSALRQQQKSAEEYRDASTYAARALDQAHVAIALTPVVATALAALAIYLG